MVRSEVAGVEVRVALTVLAVVAEVVADPEADVAEVAEAVVVLAEQKILYTTPDIRVQQIRNAWA